MDALLTYMVEVVQLMGGNETTARQQMKDVMDFARKAAKVYTKNTQYTRYSI